MSNRIKVGLFFITAGIIFAVETIYKVRLLYKLWPVILLILGGGLINIFLLRQKRDPLFLGIGVYMILFSLLAFFCNFTSWTYLSHLWPLFIAFAGLAFGVSFIFLPKQKISFFISLVLISISGVFFLVFSLSSTYWWTIFIFIGLSIMIAGGRSAAE